MTDKVQKIREEVEKLKEETSIGLSEHENGVEQGRMEIINALSIFLDSLQEEPAAPKVLKDMLNAKTAAESLSISQEEHDRIVDELIYGKEPELVDVDDLPKEEPVSNDFEMALTEMIDKAQKCVVEPWAIAAQWKDELIKLAKSEEPVSGIDFEKELYKAFGRVKDFTLGMRIAKRFYDMGKKSREPVSEGLEEAADNALNNVLNTHEIVNIRSCLEMFKAGAGWQRQQMMKDATEVTVHVEAGNYPYIPQIELYDYDKDIPLAKEGDKYKVVLIKK